VKLTIIALADYVNTAEGGKLNILGIFDRINAKDFPVRHAQMSLVLRFLCEYADSEEEHPVRVHLEAPNGAKIVEVEGAVRVPTMQPGESRTVNQVIQMMNVAFQRSGTYLLRVYLEEELAGEIPLSLHRK